MLNQAFWLRLESLVDRYSELSGLLSTQEVINEQEKFRNLSKEYRQLQPLVTCYEQLKESERQIEHTQLLLLESDAELRSLAEEELKLIQLKKDELVRQLQFLLLPKDPDDQRNIFLEIRAGAGGNEASIFVGDLHRMYLRYAESRGWQVEIISAHPSEQGGYKEIISRISGQDVYSRLKFESGVHRVQRVPTTESQGRIHTSTCTVAILVEADAINAIQIQPSDLKIDTFRASGAGGQHVNKTDSAIRMTHLPSGIIVECQDERSQHKNRAKALALLQSKLLAEEQLKQKTLEDQTRRNLVGQGKRSERIRTYNFPQGRVTDHRINLTVYQLDDVMEGKLDPIIEPLIHEDQLDQMAALGLNES